MRGSFWGEKGEFWGLEDGAPFGAEALEFGAEKSPFGFVLGPKRGGLGAPGDGRLKVVHFGAKSWEFGSYRSILVRKGPNLGLPETSLVSKEGNLGFF